jgi:hypothetical protein
MMICHQTMPITYPAASVGTSTPPQPAMVARTKHHPNGCSNGYFFDEATVSALIVDWQKSQDPEDLGLAIEACRPNILSLIRSQNTDYYETENELISRCNYKLFTSLCHWNRERGTAFNFVSWHTRNVLSTAVNEARKRADRYCQIDPTLLDGLVNRRPNGSAAAEFAEHVKYTVSLIKTTVSDPGELQAMRWMVTSLVDASFDLKRHQIGDVAMEFGLTHARSRELCDATMLAIRRLLWDEIRPKTIGARSLRGTRQTPLAKYAPFLDEREFTKLVYLLRDLAPSQVVEAKRANASAIAAGDPTATRENLMLVLEGDPAARLLFPCTKSQIGIS